MVCDRCKMAVDTILKDNGLRPTSVELGEVTVDGPVTDDVRQKLRADLERMGFELLDDKRQQTIDLVKAAIVRLVHYRDNRSPLNLSAYVSAELRQDFGTLSRLFSEVEGKTIERYYIEQRVERVKELIRYDELTLSQIALQMNYSSSAYLSNQFKMVTGMTPTQFKNLKKNTRRPIDKI